MQNRNVIASYGLAAWLLLAVAAPAAADDANDSACEVIKTYVLMGVAGDPDKRAVIDKLIPACNKSPVRCADTVKWIGLAQQKLDALTCR